MNFPQFASYAAYLVYVKAQVSTLVRRRVQSLEKTLAWELVEDEMKQTGQGAVQLSKKEKES